MQIKIFVLDIDTGEQTDMVLLAPQITGTIRAALAQPINGRGAQLPPAPLVLAQPAPAEHPDEKAETPAAHHATRPPAATDFCECGKPKPVKSARCKSCTMRKVRLEALERQRQAAAA